MYNIFLDALITQMYPSGLLHHFGVNGKVSGSIGAIGEMGGVVAVLHGPGGCAFHYRNSARRRHQPFYPLFSTELTETEIIFGGAGKLRKTVLQIHERYKPELIMIVPTPISDTLSEDVSAVAAELRESSGIPVIAIQSELFSHRDKQYAAKHLKALAKQPVTGENKLEMELLGCGFTEALYALVEQAMVPCEVQPRSVNIETLGWGAQNRPTLMEVEQFLSRCGITVNCFIPSDSLVRLKQAPRAGLNIVKRIRWAKRMEALFGTPYLHLGGAGRYDGLKGILTFYQDIAEKLGMRDEMRPHLEQAMSKALADTQSAREYLGSMCCALVSKNISSAPFLLRQYAGDYGLRVKHLVLILSPESRREKDIDEEVLQRLLSRVEEAARLCGSVRIHFNPDERLLREIFSGVDFVAGTNDITLEGAAPLIPAMNENTSLSFESYVRNVKRLQARVQNREIKGDLILANMNFTSAGYPLFNNRESFAAQEMWFRMWLQRKGAQV